MYITQSLQRIVLHVCFAPSYHHLFLHSPSHDINYYNKTKDFISIRRAGHRAMLLYFRVHADVVRLSLAMGDTAAACAITIAKCIVYRYC